MPADVAEDSLDLMIELLETDEPTKASYPFPRLRRSHRIERRTFKSILLENPHFRITVLPDLGGRIVRLEDKRVQRDIWQFDAVMKPREEGPRGIEWPTGLQVRTGFDDRLNSLGPVANTLDYSEEGEAPSGIWLGEVCGDGLSLNWRVSMQDDGSHFELEVRAFNRSLRSIPYNGGLALGEGEWRKSGKDWVWSTEGGCLLVECPYLTYVDEVGLYRFNRMRQLAPRQLDSWTAKLYPSGVGASIRGATRTMHVGWDRQEMRVQGMTEVSGKAVVLTTGGQTLEVPMELSPMLMNPIPLASLSEEISEFVFLDAERNELIRASQLDTNDASRATDDPLTGFVGPESTETEIRIAEFDVAQRHLAHVLVGNRQLLERDFQGAAQAFEQALLFNAEDHLSWWAKAAAERRAGSQTEERPELPNAHFLAPLEPVLRAEGFLATEVHGKQKSAVLSPLEATPDAFVDVACVLLESNMVQDAARWLGEAVLHADFPILRYLLSSVYLELGSMEIEAAEQVQLAVRQTPEPPFPWREVELKALERVAAKFPADGSLRRLMQLAEKSRPPQ